jgi:hypothetical protein
VVSGEVTYDVILAAVKLMAGSSCDIKMVAGWTWRDSGMEPIHVVVYDADTEDRHYRRVVVAQGAQHAIDLILEHMEGW